MSESATSVRMNPQERRATLSLAMIYVSRLLGVFMLLTVFTPYAVSLPGANSQSVGLAFGIYGLVQALLQVPFGIWSDRIGRKPVMSAGLVLFIAGSLLCAFSTNIEMLTWARALQGAGAIGGVTSALLADLTRFEVRTTALAILGMSVGSAFMLSLMLGPLLQAQIGVSGIFVFTAVCGVLNFILLWVLTPNPSQIIPKININKNNIFFDIKNIIKHKILSKLNLGVLFLHSSLTLTFYAVPRILEEQFHWAKNQQWQLYVPVVLLSLFLMMPILKQFRKHSQEIENHENYLRVRGLLRRAVLYLILAQIIFILLFLFKNQININNLNLIILGLGLVIFFGGFNSLEALQPSLISRFAPPEHKGMALSLYACLQFFGFFLGGALAGVLYASFGALAVFLAGLGLGLLWLVLG